jgi:protein SCO1/2
MGAIKTPPKRQGEGRDSNKAAPGPRVPSRLGLAMMTIGALLALGLGFASWRLTAPTSGVQGSSGVASLGGPFQLVDQEGRPVDERILKGRWSAVFFGYTYCQDVCPTTLATLGAVEREMGDRAKGLQTVLVSIDPQRDTPAQLKRYLDTPAFPPKVLGLTGRPEQVAAMAKAYRVYYAKHGDGPDYLMDHPSAIYLFDEEGRFDRLIDPAGGPKAVGEALDKAMRRS